MIVVSDTSPLADLVTIGVADALADLYGGVVIPPAVADELRHPASPARDWIASPPVVVDCFGAEKFRPRSTAR